MPWAATNTGKSSRRTRLLLGVLIAIMVSFGGLAEIIPLFNDAQTVKPAPGVKPYEPLRLAGRDVYVREGCYLLPLADDPHAELRNAALRRPFRCRRIRLRPAVPVGLEAHRAGPGARRRQILRRLAARAPAGAARARAAIEHARLSVAGGSEDRRRRPAGAHARAAHARRSVHRCARSRALPRRCWTRPSSTRWSPIYRGWA